MQTSEKRKVRRSEISGQTSPSAQSLRCEIQETRGNLPRIFKSSKKEDKATFYSLSDEWTEAARIHNKAR